MNGGITTFAIGVLGLAAAAAMVAPSPSQPSATAEPSASVPRIATPEAKPHRVAPQPRVMVSHSSSGPPVAVPGSSRPPPPIVAIPRIPGPADMMVATGRGGEVRTIQSFGSNEACDEALVIVRRTISNAFCVSTTPPPPEPEYGFLFEVRLEDNEMVALETHPSMAACERALAARTPKPGHQAGCSPKFH